MSAYKTRLTLCILAITVLSVCGCKPEASSDDKVIQENNTAIVNAMQAQAQQVAQIQNEHKSGS
jgi:hypothetical protein